MTPNRIDNMGVRENLLPVNSGQRPHLTRARISGALTIAITADLLQLCLGPFGWVGADEVIDIVAMLLTMGLLGFHPLLLPTAVLEFFPVLDLLPTWTGCVLFVIARRKQREAKNTDPVPAIVHPPPMLPETTRSTNN